MSFNGFDIDFRSLRRCRIDESIYFVFTPAAETVPPLDAQLLRELADGFNDFVARRSPANPVRGCGWLQLTRGRFAGVLTHTTDWDDVLEWLDVFANGFGPGGTIKGGPPEHGPGQPRDHLRRTEPGVYCAYSAAPEAKPFTWGVSSEVTMRLSRHMADWVVMPRATTYLSYETTTPVVDTDLALPLGEAMLRESITAVTAEVKHPYRYRSVETLPVGLTAHLWWDEGLDWQHKRPHLMRALLFSPPDLHYGFIARSGLFGWSGHFSPPWPHAREIDINRDPDVLKTQVPDAYGIQVLTPGHLDRAHDLTDWLIEDLPGDRHLVTHPDADTWYAHDVPPDAMLTQARLDFGDMIMPESDLGRPPPNPWD